VYPVVKLMQSWEASAARLCSSLGLSPQARSRMRADAAAGRVSAALEQHLASAYSEGDE
jgi:phage terminase small subunit